jgi:quercetin dioxygenase-like cupin family protein
MQRLGMMVLPLVLVLVAGLFLSVPAARPLAAQDASDEAVTRTELTPGLFAEVFAGVPSARAEGQTVYIARFTFQPGSDIFPHSHPGTVVLAIESGTLGWTLEEGTVRVVRGAGSGATEVEQVTQPGTELILEPGDAIFYEDDVVHTARGAGDGAAVVLATLILEAGEPLLMPSDMEMAG